MNVPGSPVRSLCWRKPRPRVAQQAPLWFVREAGALQSVLLLPVSPHDLPLCCDIAAKGRWCFSKGPAVASHFMIMSVSLT